LQLCVDSKSAGRFEFYSQPFLLAYPGLKKFMTFCLIFLIKIHYE